LAQGKHPPTHSTVIPPEAAEKTELLSQQLMAFMWKELYLFLKKELLTLNTTNFALVHLLEL